MQTAVPPPIAAPTQSTQSLPSSPRIGMSLGALSSKPPTSRTTNMTSHGLRPMGIPPPPTIPSTSSHVTSPPTQNAQPNFPTMLSPLSPQQGSFQSQGSSSFPKPKYNSSFTGMVPPPTASLATPPTSQSNQLYAPNIGSALSAPAVTPAFSPPAFAPRQAMGDILTPLKPQQRSSLSGVSTNKPTSKDILSDFDPLA
jgi:hypothetical protein